MGLVRTPSIGKKVKTMPGSGVRLPYIVALSLVVSTGGGIAGGQPSSQPRGPASTARSDYLVPPPGLAFFTTPLEDINGNGPDPGDVPPFEFLIDRSDQVTIQIGISRNEQERSR